MISARSSCFSSISPDQRRKSLPRSAAVFERQPGSAALAAAIARRVSAAPIFGMLPMASAVAGLLTAMVAPLSEPTHLPSM